MRKAIPIFVAGLTSLVLNSGCGMINMAGRPKVQGEENAPKYNEFNIGAELGEEPKENGLKRASWLFRKGDLQLAFAKMEEYSETKRRARLSEAVSSYESGLNILSGDLEAFYKAPYNGFTNVSLSADLFTGIFEKVLPVYREIGNKAREAFALHHLDWLSWNRQKLELHRSGLSIDAIERMDREGLLVDLTEQKYNSSGGRTERKQKKNSKVDSYEAIKMERDRQTLSARFRSIPVPPNKIYIDNKEIAISGQKVLANTELSYEDRQEQMRRIDEKERAIQRVRINADCEGKSLAFGDINGNVSYSHRVE